MTLSEFKSSLNEDAPPSGVSPYLEALWYEANENWDRAHDIIQDIDSGMAAHIHAYLHRVEGDQWNSDYWYRKAGRSRPSVDLRSEWESIVQALL